MDANAIETPPLRMVSPAAARPGRRKKALNARLPKAKSKQAANNQKDLLAISLIDPEYTVDRNYDYR